MFSGRNIKKDKPAARKKLPGGVSVQRIFLFRICKQTIKETMTHFILCSYTRALSSEYSIRPLISI